MNRTAIIAYMPWLLSAITIWMTVLAGNKHRSAWLVGLLAQAGWLLWIVYARNHFKWRVAEA